MLYIQQSLADGEELIHVGRFHWMYTLHAFSNIIFSAFISMFVIVGGVYAYQLMGKFPPDIGWLEGMPYMHPGLRIFAFIVFVSGLLGFAQKMVIKSTTEIAITNNRLVYKQGLIARTVGEININRIEGANILQSVLGRVFNYGRVAIRGMGVGEVVLPPIDDPISFRKAIEKAKEYREDDGKV